MNRSRIRYFKWRLGLLLFTLVAFVGHFWLPPKRLVIHPGNEAAVGLYGYEHAVDGMSGRWLDQSAHRFICDFKPENPHGCGLVLLWRNTYLTGLDLRGYKGVLLDARYEGKAGRVRFNMRNSHPGHTAADQANSPNFMSITLDAEEINQGEIFIGFDELSVAEWWLTQDPARRKWTTTDFGHISSFGLDFFTPGLHKAEVNRLEVIGEWIATETLLILLVGLWMIVLLAEGVTRIYCNRRDSREKAHKIEQLQRTRLALEKEKEVLRRLSCTDPLTNVPNRNGLLEFVATVQAQGRALGVMVIDLDHFKTINDRFGHDLGDAVLKQFAAHVAPQLRTGDCFGRWGGEEFVLLCELLPQEQAQPAIVTLAEKIRELVERVRLSAPVPHTLQLSVSIGAATCPAGGSFEEAFKRADAALYRAKQDGRNRVVYQA